jgi:hypothetical protein
MKHQDVVTNRVEERPLVRIRRRLEENIKVDMKIGLCYVKWINLAQDRN